MRYGSVCSGIEAASVAWEPLGWKPAWFSEIESFPSAVLAHHWPHVDNLGDMTALPQRIISGEVEAPDVLVGGTPCQAFSVAGMREGMNDERGQLTIKYVEIADAIDVVRGEEGNEPCITVWENVPGVLSDKGNAFGCFIAALAGDDAAIEPGPRPESGRSSAHWRWCKKTDKHIPKWPNAGRAVGPQRTVAWRILDAQYFGVAQRRRRVFVVASAREGFDPAEVLFEREGLRRDIAPSREEGEEVAGTLASRTGGGGFPGTDEACSGYVQPLGALTACGVGTCGADLNQALGGHLLPQSTGRSPQLMAAVLAGDGDKWGSNQWVDEGKSVVCMRLAQTSSNGCGITEGGPAYTLDGANGQAIAVSLRGREGGATAELGGDFSPTLRASSGGGDKQHVLTDMVRRLIPVECERLQGFPDNHVEIPWRKKPADQCPDGPRYKAIGNSKAVPVVRWLGIRINNVVGQCAQRLVG